jgi:hypothetical protein
MTNVTVRENISGKTYLLDAWQTTEFLAELRRVKFFWRFSFSKGRPKATVSPEVSIELNKNGKLSVLELYAGQVLFDVNKNKCYQFYMGHLLVFWLLS